MTEYIDLFLTYADPEALAVNAELEKEDGDPAIINTFYSHPVKVWNDNGTSWNSFHWHVLVTREQYDKRIADGKVPKDFTNCDSKYKKLKKDSLTEYEPLHTFGRSVHIPKEKIKDKDND